MDLLQAVCDVTVAYQWSRPGDNGLIHHYIPVCGRRWPGLLTHTSTQPLNLWTKNSLPPISCLNGHQPGKKHSTTHLMLHALYVEALKCYLHGSPAVAMKLITLYPFCELHNQEYGKNVGYFLLLRCQH